MLLHFSLPRPSYQWFLNTQLFRARREFYGGCRTLKPFRTHLLLTQPKRTLTAQVLIQLSNAIPPELRLLWSGNPHLEQRCLTPSSEISQRWGFPG